MTDLSLNVLADTVGDKGRLLTWVERLRPRSVLIMDDASLAQRIASTYPETATLYRKFSPNDAELHLQVSPTEFINSVAYAAKNGVIVQALNEPSGYTNLPELVKWCVDVMAEASKRGIRLALPNFAVGHPNLQAIATGMFDPLIRAFKRYPAHVLSVHEYFDSSPAHEPHHIGRVSHLLKQFDALRVDRPVVIVTEAGRDVGGGVNDGWKAVFNAEQYIARLQTMRDVMTRTGVYSACVFCYGGGYGERWQSFNVSDAPEMINAMAAGNRAQFPTSRRQSRRLNVPMRIRQLPTVHSPVLRVILPGQRVNFWFDERYTRDGHMWLPVEGGGWIAANVAGIVD